MLVVRSGSVYFRIRVMVMVTGYWLGQGRDKSELSLRDAFGGDLSLALRLWLGIDPFILG